MISEQKQYRILLADDHVLIRHGLGSELGRSDQPPDHLDHALDHVSVLGDLRGIMFLVGIRIRLLQG